MDAEAARRLGGGRNLVGAFHPAADVVCDLEALESLINRGNLVAAFYESKLSGA